MNSAAAAAVCGVIQVLYAFVPLPFLTFYGVYEVTFVFVARSLFE